MSSYDLTSRNWSVCCDYEEYLVIGERVMYVFIGKNAPMVSALLLSLLTLGVGVYLSFVCESTWINRSGSIVIIIGVLLGASKFYDILTNKLNVFVNRNISRVVSDILDDVEKVHGEVSAEDRKNLEDKVRSDVLSESEEIIDDKKFVLKKLELYLILVGTFVNGFGDLVIEYFK